MDNKKKFAFLITSLLVTTLTAHAMKSLTSCFPSLFCCCSKQKISNKKQQKNIILQNLEIKIKSIPTLNEKIKNSKLSFILHDVEIGYALYEKNVYTNYETNKDYIYFNRIFLNHEYRNYGLGKEMFKITMEDIHKNFPGIEIVEWSVTPIGEFESIDLINEARQNLFIFYTRCGAVVNREKNKAFINLKDAGYFDKK